MSDTEEKEEKKPLTQEDIDKYNKQMDEFYEKNIPRLERQSKYENLIADIDEARARSMEMRIRLAQMTAPPTDEENPKRKLKTD